MFCKNCGTEIKDGMAFCSNCGQPVGTNNTAANGGSGMGTPVPEGVLPAQNRQTGGFHEVDTKTERQGHLIGNILKVAVALLAVIIVITGVTKIFGNSYKKVAKQYVSAIANKDGKQFVSLFPDVYVDYVKDEQGWSQEKLEKEFQDGLEEEYENLEDKLDSIDEDADVKISFDDFDKIEECDEDDLKDIEERLNKYTEEKDEVKVKQAYSIDVRIKVEAGKNEAKTSRSLPKIAKVNGKWCIIP